LIAISTRAEGLTLIELLVALVIVAILAIATLPLYQHYLSENRIKGASEGLYHLLVLARTEALKRQAVINVVFQTGSNWCYGMTTLSTCDCQSAGACNIGQASSVNYTNVSLALTGITNNVTVEPSRGEVSPIGTITFSSGSMSIEISLNAMGGVRICSDTVGGYIAC
jgi:type IV fimbrial biogenesis protein FimT